MPKLSIFPTLLREVFASRSLPREPEPALVMDDAEQVAAYAYAGRIDGVMSASYLFQSARVCQVIQGAKRVIDLGCGPATQLAQIAELNPEIHFTGVDLSDEMLAKAREHIADRGLKNVEFVRSDITTLRDFADASVDGVISTMALHHLPTLPHLERCFTEIKRVLRSGGAIYLVDFGRLKSLKSVIYFAYMNSRHQPHLFSLDYERSLRAAFEKEEFHRLAGGVFGNAAQVYSTHLIPILVVVKTADKVLPDETRKALLGMVSRLPPKYRADLNDIRLFLKLGGLSNDPF